MSIFSTRTTDETTEITLNYAPNGRIWNNKRNTSSNLYKFFRGLSDEQNSYVQILNNIFDANLPRVSTLELERHERDLSIPDAVFDKSGTIEDRQRDVIIKRYMMRSNTEQNFIDIAAIYGIEIRVTRLINNAIFPLQFPIVFSPDVDTARNTILIEFVGDFDNVFPLPFPMPFAPNTSIEKLKRIYNAIKPITTQIIYTP